MVLTVRIQFFRIFDAWMRSKKLCLFFQGLPVVVFRKNQVVFAKLVFQTKMVLTIGKYLTRKRQFCQILENDALMEIEYSNLLLKYPKTQGDFPLRNYFIHKDVWWIQIFSYSLIFFYWQKFGPLSNCLSLGESCLTALSFYHGHEMIWPLVD